MNYSDYRFSLLEDFSNCPAVSPPHLPAVTVLTPPSTAERGKKGRTRSKRTVPKADKPENLTLSLATPPESPEDCLNKNCHHDNLEMMSDADGDIELEEEEMQDYR